VERASEDSSDVGVDRRLRQLEGEARDGARGITTYAGQRPKRGDVVRHPTLVGGHDLAREAVEIVGPAIVA
jgi:hypothetical protein